VRILGLVIGKQRPLGKAVFVTLEDEFGYIPPSLWTDVYDRHQTKLNAVIVVASGRISKRTGTINIRVSSIMPIDNTLNLPVKEWR
jgi:error-prone DNA polymerase